MESEKVKEIKKALEYCQGESLKSCEYCPYWNWCKEDDGLTFKSDILNLINELEEENERLQEENYIIKSNPPIIAGRSIGKTIRAKLIDYDKLKQFNKSLKDRIAELEKENKDYKDRCELIHDLGFDYDGSKTIEDFKILVDELVLVAINGAQVKKGLDNKLKTKNQQLKDRIAELETENARLDKVVKHFQELIEDGKLISSEQLKQFAERLKDRLKDNVNGDNVDYYVECAIYIDETLKDFINQDKNYTEVR